MELDSKSAEPTSDKQIWRDLFGFWILGLCNNFGYSVMLSAAHDIISSFSKQDTTSTRSLTTIRKCQIVSSGVILLANIIPGVIIKVIAPFLEYSVNTKVAASIFLTVISFVLVAFSTSKYQAILGVACTSVASGLGESTFLSYTSYFDRNTLSTWSSGTGGSSVVASIAYALLIGAGISNRDTMLVMLIIPIIQCIGFWVILRKPQIESKSEPETSPDSRELVGCLEKVLYIRTLLRYMVPLFLVYFFEYVINQGLFELEYYDNTFLDKDAQYRWFSVDYQIGVFISRSSVNLIHFRKIWIFALLQFFNFVYFLTEVIYFYTPTIWIPFAVIFWEGLLGGGAYVNTFYRMTMDIPQARQEFALGATLQANSIGILAAGLLAMPLHNAICRTPQNIRFTIW